MLASSSSGNCSILVRGDPPLQRVTLIDAGLSPRRTRRLLCGFGLAFEQVDDVLFTHFDSDHCHAGWVRGLPAHTRLRAHARHRAAARRSGLPVERFLWFEDTFDLRGGARVRTAELSHDAEGSTAYRFDLPPDGGGASLGYATDLGRATGALIDLMAGVDSLAIESNYCPRLQRASGRPEELQRRIMDGAGHLSNEQCRDAVRAIAPRRRVVLLHLSRECNDPGLAASYHRGAGYDVVVAHDREPTPLLALSETLAA